VPAELSIGDDSDVEIGHQDDDPSAALGATDADVVEPATGAQGDRPGGINGADACC